MSQFQTDALRPSSLPTATLGRRRDTQLDQDSTANGDQNDKNGKFGAVAEEWNVRIDKEVKAVSTGLKELIELADIGESPNVDSTQINALHLKLKTSQLIRSAQGIRDLAHELKLMLLLSDQVEEASRRDKEALEVGKEVEEGRRRVGQELASLLRGGHAVKEGEGEGSGTEETKLDNGDGDGMEVDKTENAGGQEDGEMQKEEAEETSKDDRMGEGEEDEDEDEGFEQVA